MELTTLKKIFIGVQLLYSVVYTLFCFMVMLYGEH